MRGIKQGGPGEVKLIRRVVVMEESGQEQDK